MPSRSRHVCAPTRRPYDRRDGGGDGNGDETPRSTEARRIADEIAKRTGLPIDLVDERYTTAAALRAVREMGGSTKGRKGDVDALAATVLLQHALARAG